jgi:hypothetical protein
VIVRMQNTCGICGTAVESRVPANWHPSKLARRAERDMAAHLRTHSLAELLRYEIRKDLDQVPDEQRPSIVRDVYRQLLGTTTAERGFALNAPDGQGLYTIDEVLGHLEVYRLWQSDARCGDPSSEQHAPA